MGEPLSSEQSLIAEAAAGNMGAFAQLVNAHRLNVLRLAYGMVHSVDEAEDIAQEVFVKVWKNLPTFRSQGSFQSWLYRITVNTALDVLRRRQEEVPLEEQAEAQGEDAPEEATLRQDRLAQVRQAIAELPPGARAVLILREYEQLSYKEIAEILQIPLGTVMSRLNYARQALQKKLVSGQL
jgi:RNA polymerase sigma-70 factor (ECF subfamily)